MIIWGMSKNGHDWSIAIFKDDNLANKFVLRSTISGKGREHTIASIKQARELGAPNLVVWYENPYLKSIRQFVAGQPKPFSRNNIKKYLRGLGITCKWTFVGHHKSHAAAYYKSGFDDATIVVIDSIGEFDCTSIWHAQGRKLKKKSSVKYPHSIGLFYSAMTDRVGLKAQQDESKFEEMSQTFLPFSSLRSRMETDLIKTWTPLPKFKVNFHRGIRNAWPSNSDKEIASAARGIFERLIGCVLWKARKVSDSRNIVLSGGVAFNKAMPELVGSKWDNLYIPPNPSDTGSAEGAVLAYLNNG